MDPQEYSDELQEVNVVISLNDVYVRNIKCEEDVKNRDASTDQHDTDIEPKVNAGGQGCDRFRGFSTTTTSRARGRPRKRQPGTSQPAQPNVDIAHARDVESRNASTGRHDNDSGNNVNINEQGCSGEGCYGEGCDGTRGFTPATTSQAMGQPPHTSQPAQSHVDSLYAVDVEPQNVTIDKHDNFNENNVGINEQGCSGEGCDRSRVIATVTTSRARGCPRTRQNLYKFQPSQLQASTASLSPVILDFSLLSPQDRLIQTVKWQKRFDMVRTRPQFRIVSVCPIPSFSSPSKPQNQTLAVTFCRGFVLEGTFNTIMTALNTRIVEAVEASYEQDAAASALADTCA
jgi:hypothetical protein